MIRLQGRTKLYGPLAALDNVILEVRDGEFLALLGPSGSGTTPLLRIIAGLAFPDGGRVEFNGEDVTQIKLADRRVGFVRETNKLPGGIHVRPHDLEIVDEPAKRPATGSSSTTSSARAGCGGSRAFPPRTEWSSSISTLASRRLRPETIRVRPRRSKTFIATGANRHEQA